MALPQSEAFRVHQIGLLLAIIMVVNLCENRCHLLLHESDP